MHRPHAAQTRALALAAGLLAAAPAAGRLQAQQPDRIPAAVRADAQRLIDAALADTTAWHRIAYAADRFGPRLSGSQSLEDALDWILAEMKKDGLQNVRGEPVLVPHWVRGEESLAMVEPRAQPMRMLGLGGSIATPAEGITAPVLVVGSFDDLEARAAEAKGKIVVFDAPFVSYGQTVQYRTGGAVAAAKAGAVASLIRSVGPFGMQTPHTGTMRYEEGVPKIPHAAITMEDAMMLHRMQDRGVTPVLTLKMGARTLPDAESRNVVAEIVGSEKPEEIVVLGGHSDSWDVGQGVMDDLGGCVVSWEAVRLMKELGLRPKRTIRVVLWTNEENGLRGAREYARAHADEKHVWAIESDGGVFKPLGFGVGANDGAFAIAQQIGTLLAPIGADRITRGGGGADIGPLMETGVPGLGLSVAGDYFWFHHTEADTMDKQDPRAIAESVAAMAVMAYAAAQWPEAIPQGTGATSTY